jgi:glycosyltransferase involved in cell wall biosynthesis
MFYFSLLHYLLIGEKRGNLPNPFFDPNYFMQQSGSCHLSDYLCDQKFWRYSPSRFFDTQWYASHNYWQATATHPFVHFWAHGFDEGRHPSKQFDITFFKKAVMRDRPDKKAFSFELFADGAPDLPWNATDLEERRNRFYSKVVLEVLRQSDRANYPYLVFVQASQSSNMPFLKSAHKFDVAVNYYDRTDIVPANADYVLRQIGTKTTAIRKILEERPDLFLRYDAVLFLDDDIAISTEDIEKLFTTMTNFGLDLAQASLSPDSGCHFDVLKQPMAGVALTPLTAVEIMMPVISNRALRECGWVFQEGISGWGIDLLLSANVREKFGNTIALVGKAVARHEKVVDTLNGRFYRFLKTHGIDATIEAGDIASRFNIDDTREVISVHPQPLRHSLDDGRTVAPPPLGSGAQDLGEAILVPPAAGAAAVEPRRPEKSGEIIFLDNGLMGRGEHSYSLLKQVGEALTRRGLRHRAFGTKSMDRSVAVELGVVPHFTFPLYFGVAPSDIELRRRRSFFARLLGIEADASTPSEFETWRVLNDSFGRDLDGLPPDVWSAGNLLIVPGLSQNELLGLIRGLLARPQERRPRVVAQLMFAPNWTTWGGKARLGTKFYRKAFARARPLIGKTLFFTTENQSIADLYRRNFGIDAEILPVPFGDMPLAAPLAKKPTFGFFGYSKGDKGFHLLPRAIELCRARGVEAEFTIQIQHSGWEPATVAAEGELRRLDGVRLIEGVLDEKAYVAETGRIDAMLLPYDPVLFGLRGSGIFTQSVSAGRPVVASAGTFAGASIASSEAEGEVFAPYEAQALADAIMRLADRLPESQARAEKLAKAFARKHSADAYVDVLVAHAAR